MGASQKDNHPNNRGLGFRVSYGGFPKLGVPLKGFYRGFVGVI